MKYFTIERLCYFQVNLKQYVENIFQGIVSSGLLCPTEMCEVFFALKEIAHSIIKGILE